MVSPGPQKKSMDSGRIRIEADRKLLLWSKTALDSLSARVAVLDEDGFILETNRAWKEFARASGIRMRPDTVGVNYLSVCDKAEGRGFALARKAAAGIRSVISGESGEFVMEYPCHSPYEKCWYNIRVTRLRLEFEGPMGLVVSHENVTNVKQAHITLRRRDTELQLETLKLEEANAALRRREADLEREAHKLEEANAALRVLVRQRDEDRREIEEKVVSQVKELVQPYLDRLKPGAMDQRYKNLIEVVESNLNDIISPFAHKLSSRFLSLTPSEIRIAGLVKEGFTSKEIAEILSISSKTVEFHRENIRKRLGLKGRRDNLRTHLLTL
ncbi:MAG: PAS domain-containing protein [Deltaproteobacteria bacterium]|nr:PAS domain-containing protein [Deltaproteobacteria bacterium]